MKIEIESDVFDIVERVKEIDDGYRIVYDTVSDNLELHNINQKNSFCLNIKNNQISPDLINLILKSEIRYIDTIISEIDSNNEKIEKENSDNVRDLTSYMAGEVFAFANNSSKEFECNKAFGSKWR
ncbi:MAG: hypothetical protein E7354_00905 [Clostridiales bacterium]|nr:hypothetical protein [Clostridiales bacterium]